MKNILTIIACLAVLICFAGCPAGDSGSGSSKDTGAVVTGNAGKPAHTPASDDENPLAADIEISDGVFDVAGVRLGMTWDAWIELYPESSGIIMDSAWVAKGETGIVSVFPDSDIAPIDSAWFLQSQLVGFTSDFDMTQAEFEARIEMLEEKSGKSDDDLPDWVMEIPFFSGYQGPSDERIQGFWFNETGREVLMCFHLVAEDFSSFSLINVDLLDGRIENALMAKMDEAQETDFEEETDESDVIDYKPEIDPKTGFDAVPSDRFGFDGVYLGADSNLIKGRYEMLGLAAMGMWVDRDWTGRIDGNPTTDEILPSGAAWFLEGGLVGFVGSFVGTETKYSEAIAYMVGLHGEPLVEVPKWARESAFFSVHDIKANEEAMEMWVDEESRGMFLIGFESEEQIITTMLVDLDKYLEAMDITNEMVETQGHS